MKFNKVCKLEASNFPRQQLLTEWDFSMIYTPKPMAALWFLRELESTTMKVCKQCEICVPISKKTVGLGNILMDFKSHNSVLYLSCNETQFIF